MVKHVGHQGLDASRFEADIFSDAVARAPLLDMKATVGLSRVEEEYQRTITELRRRGDSVRRRAVEAAGLALVAAVVHDRIRPAPVSHGQEDEAHAEVTNDLTAWYKERVESSLDDFSSLYKGLLKEGFSHKHFQTLLHDVQAGHPPVFITPPQASSSPVYHEGALGISPYYLGGGTKVVDEGLEDEERYDNRGPHEDKTCSPRLLNILLHEDTEEGFDRCITDSLATPADHCQRQPSLKSSPLQPKVMGVMRQTSPKVKAIPYKQFLDRLMRPDSAELLDYTRQFINSVLGPNGDGKTLLLANKRPIRTKALAALSGASGKDLRTRCAEFFGSMEETFKVHSAWKKDMGMGHVRAVSIRNALEKYVMERIGKVAFKSEMNDEMDKRLDQRMQALSFLEPSALDIKPAMQNALVLAIAQEELRRLDKYVAPGDKLHCVGRAAEAVFSALEHAKSLETDSESFGGPGRAVTTDDFLPVFILVVLRARVPRLFSTCEYIHGFHNPADMMGRIGCLFAHLQSAMHFLMVVDASMLNVDQERFVARMAESTALITSGEKMREALCRAIIQDNFDGVRRLLDVDPAALHVIHPTHGSPLRIACCKASPDIVRHLLDRGAPVNQTTTCGATVLFWACFNKRSQTVHLLLERGADPLIIQKNGLSPLSVSACNGAINIVVGILDRIKEDKNFSEWLSEALWGGLSFDQPAVVKLLLERGADFRAPNHKGKTPLDFARFKGFVECENLLAEAERAYAVYKARRINDDVDSISKRLKMTPLSPEPVERERQLGVMPSYLRGRITNASQLPVVDLAGAYNGGPSEEEVTMMVTDDAVMVRADSMSSSRHRTEAAVADHVHSKLNDDMFHELIDYLKN